MMKWTRLPAFQVHKHVFFFVCVSFKFAALYEKKSEESGYEAKYGILVMQVNLHLRHR